MRHFIDIVTQNLCESMDTAMPLIWHDHSTEDMRLYQAKFDIGDGHYVVQFKRPYYDHCFEITFVRNESLDLTGTGSAHTVIATVMSAIRYFVRNRDPRLFRFSGKNDEPSRNRLYPRLARMIVAEFPDYTVRERHTRQYTSYEFERPARPLPQPDPVPEPETVPEDVPEVSWEELEAMLADIKGR